MIFCRWDIVISGWLNLSLNRRRRVITHRKAIYECFPKYEIRVLVRQTAAGIIEIGQKLIEVKEALPHGSWLPWLEGEFGWSDDTARRFMNVAGKFRNLHNLDDIAIGPSALYLLAAPSTPESAREEAIERAEAGESITNGQVVSRVIRPAASGGQ